MVECSVSGVLIFGEPDEDRVRLIEGKLRDIVIKAEERGRDSWGIVTLSRGGEFKVLKAPGRASETLPSYPRILDSDAVAAIANNRAEPTTEYVREKGLNDIQPMISENIAVSHNGTIANDVELEGKYGVKKISQIDSSILPPLLESAWDGSLEGLQRLLRDDVVGLVCISYNG